MPWQSLARLRGVPFWQEMYHTERRPGASVDAFTPQVIDPLVCEAVALQGAEESHHAKLIRVMIDRYGLEATERPLEALSTSERPSSISASVSAWIAFLGFSAFKTARRFELLPDDMFEIFDVLMHEETRYT